MFLNLLTSFGATISINGSSTQVNDGDLLAMIFAFIGALLIPILIIFILSIVAMWKIFTKCGVEGWKSIIPIYNLVVMLQIVGINPLWILATFIPLVGGIFSLILAIAANIRLAKGFGKSDGFAVGLILLSFIFELILAFDSSTWDASKINYEGFSFLNGQRPAGASKSSSAKASSAKSAKKDDWVEGK
jgi:hypothetical protein